MRSIVQTLAALLLMLFSVAVTSPVAARPNTLHCGPYVQEGVCSSPFSAGDKVLIHPGVTFVWLRDTPSSFGHILNTVWPSSSPVLQIITGTPAWDGYQNWFFAAPIGKRNAGGWVEQASLSATPDPDLPTTSPRSWLPPMRATLRAGVSFAWIRDQGSSYAGTLATIFPGSVFTVTGNHNPIFDSVQWWWPVFFAYPDGTSTVEVDGWLEQDSIVPAVPIPIITPVILPTPTSPGSAYSTFTTGAAYQPFDHGFMIWTVWNQQVYVFYYSGVVVAVPLSSYGPLRDNPVTDPTPPGKIKPIRGFGRVWGNFPSYRLILGWGLTSEQGYSARVVQPTYPLTDLPTVFQITIPDGRTLWIDGNSWHF